MSWINNIVVPRIKTFIGRSPVKDNLWTKCPECDKLIYSQELKNNLMVCSYCSYHFSLPAKARFESIFDDGKYEDIKIVRVIDDPLKYKDLKKYSDRLKEARQKTGAQDVISIACGTIKGRQAVAFVMNFAFMGGSMGLSFGKSFAKAINFAIDHNAALIGFTASGGARMQEGILSLMQMPSTIAALCNLKESGLPYINVFTNPTTGGVLASFSMLGDIHIAEPKALIGFSGARVIEKTIKCKLPEGFQKSEFLKERGMIDLIAHRHQISETLGNILDYIGGDKHVVV
ncbi:MAG: acetyl-CoA carboxylase, carboxyltransferase subunit beta [Holosporales bacterium]|jgi:acetyl-CoA carboxylase carboxyl transferase subunit beta|nr:acetyl-CoA carboxylase, carboxyltransferase subunit beta [Holosporales bacterium]